MNPHPKMKFKFYIAAIISLFLISMIYLDFLKYKELKKYYPEVTYLEFFKSNGKITGKPLPQRMIDFSLLS